MHRRWSTRLADQAYVVGGDGYWFLSDARNWVINGKLAASRVSGSTTVIDTLQRASQRYYQRPDAPEVSLDPNRTSLAGFNGRVNLNRNSGTWRFNASLWGVSPGFEVNDLGFMGTGDRAGAHAVSHLAESAARSSDTVAIVLGVEVVHVEFRPSDSGRRPPVERQRHAE